MWLKIKRFVLPFAEHLFHMLGHFITRYCHENLSSTLCNCTRDQIGDSCNDCKYYSVCECRGDCR